MSLVKRIALKKIYKEYGEETSSPTKTTKKQTKKKIITPKIKQGKLKKTFFLGGQRKTSTKTIFKGYK